MSQRQRFPCRAIARTKLAENLRVFAHHHPTTQSGTYDFQQNARIKTAVLLTPPPAAIAGGPSNLAQRLVCQYSPNS